MWNSLIQNNPGFAFPSLSAGAALLYVVALIGAVIWMRSLPPKNAVRLAFRQRTATILIVLAVLGILQMITRAFWIDGIEWRLWSYLIFVAFLGYLGYAFWYARNRLPALINQSSKVKSNFQQRKAMPSKTPAGSDVVEVRQQPRPIATTGRREARRSKKKK